jgi:hypothetical protein
LLLFLLGTGTRRWGPRNFLIEVKSKISGESDLIRGLYQCIKYKAVAVAEETYQVAKSASRTPRDVRVLLVTGSILSKNLEFLRCHIGVEAAHVTR